MNDFDQAYQMHCDAQEEALAADISNGRRCPNHPRMVISSPDGRFDGPCGECEAEMEDERYERCVSDGAGGMVAEGSLDDPGVGTWAPEDEDCSCGVPLDDHGDDERHNQQGA